MKIKVRNMCDLFMGVLFIVSVILGYYKNISYMSEYCFISGIIVGMIFFVSFFYGLIKKTTLPDWLYFDCMISIFIIFIATVAIRLNLDGAFWFIHIINPLLIFVYWLIFCNHTKIGKIWGVATDVVFPLCYFLFAFIMWRASGNCPFPASLILVGNSLTEVIMYILIVVAVFLVLGYGLHYLNAFIQKKIFKNECH